MHNRYLLKSRLGPEIAGIREGKSITQHWQNNTYIKVSHYEM